MREHWCLGLHISARPASGAGSKRRVCNVSGHAFNVPQGHPRPGFSRHCFPLRQPGNTTFGEPVPPDLSPVATFPLRALRESTLDELHDSFSRTQDISSRAPLRARSRPSQRLKPIPFRNGSARLKACPDTKPVIPKRAPKCGNFSAPLVRCFPPECSGAETFSALWAYPWSSPGAPPASASRSSA